MFEPVRVIVGVSRHPELPGEERIPDDNLERIFRRLDSIDGCFDGTIESGRLLEMLHLLDRRRTSEEFRAALTEVKRADTNQDGRLDRREFYTLMCNLRESAAAAQDEEEDDVEQGHHRVSKSLRIRRESAARSAHWLEHYLNVAANAEQYRWFPPPWFITFVTLIQVCFFVYHIFHFLGKDERTIYTTWYGPYPKCSVLIFNPHRRHEAWRYASYVLVHAGGQHLLVNVFLQLLVGLPLEMSNGSLRVAAVYMAGTLAGSLGVSTASPQLYLAGSSGAVFGLVGGHCASMILNWKEDKLVIRQRLRNMHKYTLSPSADAAEARSSAASALSNGDNTSETALKKASKAKKLRILRLSFALLLAGMDVITSLTADCQGAKNTCTTLEAHVCGMAAGALAGLVVLRNRKAERWESRAKLVCAALLLAALAVSSTWALVGDDVWRAHTGGAEGWFAEEEWGIEKRRSCNYKYHYF